jgi:septal ring factor EnvC (AmiA/AmiB activator)
MSQKCNQYSFSLVFLLLPMFSWGQDYSPKILDSSLEIEGKQFAGYRTTFAFTPAEVKKGLWKYCQSFARLTNKKKYYEIEIPSNLNESNTDVILYATITPSGEQSIFKMAVESSDLPKTNVENYNQQARSLMLEFKQTYYRDYYQGRIDEKIKEARKLSKQYEKLASREEEKPSANQLLGKLKGLEKEIERLRQIQISI